MRMGYIKTDSKMSNLKRAEQIYTSITEVADWRCHVAYEEFFGTTRNLSANYQRGYLDGVMQKGGMPFLSYILGEVGYSWWMIHPSYHLRWFHPDGKAKKVFTKSEDPRGYKELEYQHEVLMKRNKINLYDTDDSAHPLTTKKLEFGSRGWYKRAGHVFDALAMGLLLHHAITLDLNKNVTSSLTPPQIQCIANLRNDYPALTKLA